jgi:hypothetical protein
LAELKEKVFPGWVGALDELDLAAAEPALQFFFAGDRVNDVCEGFEVDEAINLVFPGVPVVGAFAVLRDSDHQAIGDADVEISGAARDDVHEIGVILGHCGRVQEKQVLRLRLRMTISKNRSRSFGFTSG